MHIFAGLNLKELLADKIWNPGFLLYESQTTDAKVAALIFSCFQYYTFLSFPHKSYLDHSTEVFFTVQLHSDLVGNGKGTGRVLNNIKHWDILKFAYHEKRSTSLNNLDYTL